MICVCVCVRCVENVHCAPQSFRCTKPAKCIPAIQRCDHENHCADGSDEEDCKLLLCLGEGFSCIHTCVL